MEKFLRAVIKSFCIVVFSFALGAAAAAESLAITHATIIDTRTGAQRRDSTVIISAHRIADVYSGSRGLPKDTRVVDARDKYLIPGLWDMHVHIAGLAADPKWSRDLLLPLLVAHGITGVRDMGGDLSALQSWRRDIEAGKLMGPHIVAAGPMLDSDFEDPNVINVRSPEQARAAVAELQKRGADFVKILSNMSRESYFALAEESKKRGMALVGHVPPTISAREASEAGQKDIEHILYGGIALACSSREAELQPQLAEAMKSGRIRNMAKALDEAAASYDAAKAKALWATFVKNGTWEVPTLVSTYISGHLDEISSNDPEMQYLPQELRDQWSPEKILKYNQPDKLKWFQQQLEQHLKLVGEMHQAGVKLLAGSDSLDPHDVPGSTLHRELELLVKAGLTPLEALQTATLLPAQFLDMPQYGVIAKDKVADFLVLDADPLVHIANTRKIAGVVLNGRYLSAADLSSLLDEVKKKAAAVAPAPAK